MAIVSVVPLCVKLIDFGMAKRVKDLGLSSHSPNRGTFLFMPAEAKDDDWRMVQCDASVDVFATGVTLLACAFGEDFEEIGKVKTHLPPRLVNDLLSDINASWPDATDILTSMLSEDPIERPSCKAILKDPWVRRGISVNDENEALRKALEVSRRDADRWESELEESKEKNAALQEALDESRKEADWERGFADSKQQELEESLEEKGALQKENDRLRSKFLFLLISLVLVFLVLVIGYSNIIGW